MPWPRWLLSALALMVAQTASAAPDERHIDPELRRLARDAPSRVVGAVLELPSATPTQIAALRARGVRFRTGRFGSPLHVGAAYPVDAPAWLLWAIRDEGRIVTVGRGRPATPTATTGTEIGTWSVEARGPVPLAGPTGDGTTILDVDTGIDVFHPHFFRADAGAYPWVDLDGDGVLTPGVDAIDADTDGTIDDHEILALMDYATWAYATGGGFDFGGLDGEFDPGVDYVYLDFDGNGLRDYGASEGYDESSPGYGEATFVPDDANGDGMIDTTERLVLLGTSRFAAVRYQGLTYRRGVDLVELPRETPTVTSHGTGMAGTIVGGHDRGLRRHRGLLLDADMLLFSWYWDYDEADMVEAVAWGAEEDASVVLHEHSSWIANAMDGSRPLDAAIDESTAAGLVHVCPAGNLAHAGKHAQVTVGTEPVSLDFVVPGSGFGYAWLDVHWPDTAVELTCTLDPAFGTALQIVEGTTQNIVEGSVSSVRFDSPRGTATLSLTISAVSWLWEGTWSLSCTHDATSLRVDAYLDDDLTGWDPGVAFVDAQPLGTLCSPATADSCISVGGYELANANTAEAGEIGLYTGFGPRIDGGRTIDVTAPSDPWVPYPATYEGFDGLLLQNNYRTSGGTSGAAPHVATVVAMLHEAEPGLEPGEIASRIKDTAAEDEFVDSDTSPDHVWGHGKLRGHEALYGEPAPPQPQAVSRPMSVTFAPADGRCTASLNVDGVDWPDATFRWDTDYDGTWDTEFVSGDEMDVVIDAPVDTIAARVDFGRAGWRVGGATVLAPVPADCFDVPPESDDSGEGSSGESEDPSTASNGATHDGGSSTAPDADDGSSGGPAGATTGSGCGCRHGTGTPTPLLLIVLVQRLRRRRSRTADAERTSASALAAAGSSPKNARGRATVGVASSRIGSSASDRWSDVSVV